MSDLKKRQKYESWRIRGKGKIVENSDTRKRWELGDESYTLIWDNLGYPLMSITVTEHGKYQVNFTRHSSLPDEILFFALDSK